MPPEENSVEPAEVKQWRRGERERLIAQRRALDGDLRRVGDAAIIGHLDAILGPVAERIVSLYWPFRAEPDLRGWAGDIIARGGRVALPVVVRKAAPLIFRAWAPGGALIPGIWNIPVPAAGDEVAPDVVIAPVVGFDPACYRLGYGGGFFDRTLAELPQALAIGVGYSEAVIPTIHPQPHDIPMRTIVTPDGPRDAVP